MTKTIDPSRLKALRKRSDLSQVALGKEAKINKQTIYRIEAGHQDAIRPSTVEKLAKALGVTPEILTGHAPLPGLNAERPAARPSNNYSINVPVDGAIRNALSLTALRYGIPIARIVELAPFLFVLAAEASLAWRREKLAELQTAMSHAESIAESFPHLPDVIRCEIQARDTLRAEKQSINARDIMATNLPNDIFVGRDTVELDYCESEHNPFVLYLKKISPTDGAASIRDFNRSSTDFDVCREDALKLADGDKELKDSIVDGTVMLHEMPRELLNDSHLDARIAWLREKHEANQADIQVLQPTDLDL